MNAKCLIKIARIPPNSPEFYQEFRFGGILCLQINYAQQLPLHKLQQLAERNKWNTHLRILLYSSRMGSRESGDMRR